MSRFKDRKAWLREFVKVSNDPATSEWLKNVIMEVVDREPLEAERDAEIVLRICQLRARTFDRGATPSEGTSKSASSPRRRTAISKSSGSPDIPKAPAPTAD